MQQDLINQRKWGFLETSLNSVCDAFIRWKKKYHDEKQIQRSTIDGSLSACLGHLEPKEAYSHRYLFLPTRSQWIALFDNTQGGSDPGTVNVLARELGVRSVFLNAVQDTLDPTLTLGEYGSIQLILGAGQDKTRSIWSIRGDDGEWEFGTLGDVQPFERSEYYQRENVIDRFTVEILNEYLQALDIHAFDSDFYCPDHRECWFTFRSSMKTCVKS